MSNSGQQDRKENSTDEKKKPGLLIEDRNSLEVQTDAGDRIVRTIDRAATAKAMKESKDNKGGKPLHD